MDRDTAGIGISGIDVEELALDPAADEIAFRRRRLGFGVVGRHFRGAHAIHHGLPFLQILSDLGQRLLAVEHDIALGLAVAMTLVAILL